MEGVESAIAALPSPLHWDTYFTLLARLVASRSPSDRIHVGCVLVRDNRLVSSGYNGFVAGLAHEPVIRVDVYGISHEINTVHAEQNAITDAARRGISVNQTVAYITHFPCMDCAKALISAGIRRVVYRDYYKNDPAVIELFELVEKPLAKYK